MCALCCWVCVGGVGRSGRRSFARIRIERERENLITSIKTYIWELNVICLYFAHTDDDMVSITYTDFNLKQIC